MKAWRVWEDMAEYPALFVQLLFAFDSNIRMESGAFESSAACISNQELG
jgi:hypothetical protein